MVTVWKNRSVSAAVQRHGRSPGEWGTRLWGCLILASVAFISAMGPATAAANTGTDPPELTEGFIYFRAGTQGHLKAVSQFFPADLDAHELGLALLKALTAGPQTPNLLAPLPRDSRVNAVFITPEGDAYVDLELPGGRLDRPDTISEILGVYSLVNSLALNIPGISRVKILVNGEENGSLGGHVSLTPFFKPNILIVK